MDDGPSAPTPAPRPFPSAAWRELGGADFRLIDLIAYLSRRTAERSPKRAHYCRPGRAYLAARLRCSVTTISRHTTKLARLGVLNKIQRRPVRGQWQTCLYSLNGPTAWNLCAVIHKIRALPHRMSKVARIALSKNRETDETRPKESLREIIARGMAKFAPP